MQDTWQWIADSALALVAAIGGIVFKDFHDRLKALEEANKDLVTNAYLDDRLGDVLARQQEQTNERRVMHRENAARLDALTARIDSVLFNR